MLGSQNKKLYRSLENKSSRVKVNGVDKSNQTQ